MRVLKQEIGSCRNIVQVLDQNKPDILLEVEKANRRPAEEVLGRMGYKTRSSIGHGGYENLLLRIG